MSVLIQEKKLKSIQQVESEINSSTDIVIRDQGIVQEDYAGVPAPPQNTEPALSTMADWDEGPSPLEILFRTPVLNSPRVKNKSSILHGKQIKNISVKLKSRGSRYGGLHVNASGSPSPNLIPPQAFALGAVLGLAGLCAGRTFLFPDIQITHTLEDKSVYELSIDQILERIHEEKLKIKQHNKYRVRNRHRWITFNEVVPHWGGLIDRRFASGQLEGPEFGSLSSSSSCVMGEADNNKAYDKYGNTWSICSGCSYLANGGLKLFSTYGLERVEKTATGIKISPIRLTSEDGWKEYKARFEYHWNIHHKE